MEGSDSMYQEIGLFEYANQVLENMEKGVFLTTSHAGKTNTMTIGWGGITVIWGRPIFMVLVRDSRATFELIDNSDNFTVSIPILKDMNAELVFCGTKSMREHDKFKACNLHLLPGRSVSTPVIKEAGLHYECKILYKQTLDQDVVPQVVKTRYYNPEVTSNTNHTVYLGEIVDKYVYKDDDHVRNHH